MSSTRLISKIFHNIYKTNYKNCINRSIYINTRLLKCYKYILKKSIRLAQKNMEINKSNLLSPPEHIRGMKILDKSKIKKEIKVPIIQLGDVVISKVMPCVKKYLLKMENLKPVQTDATNKYVLLHPGIISKWEDIDEDDRNKLKNIGITSNNFSVIDYELNYDNYRADELLKFILPEDKDSVAGFSKIGHIIHLNLRDHVIDYKNIIGEILLEKIHGAKTVVNKLDKIDSTYRNFEMEILCGDSNMNVQVKENHCTFEFDFSTVYWNPRLSTEHERIVKMINPGDVLYDVFSGVGPFSIPAAKKKCRVFANDLNPESFKWLKHNMKINKIKDDVINVFNKDGRDFITGELRDDLEKRLGCTGFTIHITMNLPALATEFLDAFNGLFNDIEIVNHPVVHVYCFAKGEDPVKIARDLTETGLGHPLSDNLIEIFNIRKVSSYKEMMRVSFRLTKDILCGRKRKNFEDETFNKKFCHGEEQGETDEKCLQSDRCEKSQN